MYACMIFTAIHLCTYLPTFCLFCSLLKVIPSKKRPYNPSVSLGAAAVYDVFAVRPVHQVAYAEAEGDRCVG